MEALAQGGGWGRREMGGTTEREGDGEGIGMGRAKQ